MCSNRPKLSPEVAIFDPKFAFLTSVLYGSNDVGQIMGTTR
jgi:hypothetical protein